MEEGADQNEKDHMLQNENSELENDNINDATMVNSSEELVKSPIHGDETAVEEEPIEQDTQPGDLEATLGLVDRGSPSATKSAEEAVPTEPEGSQEHTEDAEPTEPEGAQEHAEEAAPTEPEGAQEHAEEAAPTEPEGAQEHAEEAAPTEPEGAQEHAEEAAPTEPEGAQEHAEEAAPTEPEGAQDHAEEAAPTEPEGARDHADLDPDGPSPGGLALEDGEAPPEVNPLSREDSVAFECPGARDPETPERDALSAGSPPEEDGGGESKTPAEAAAAVDGGDSDGEDGGGEDGDDGLEAYVRLHDRLCAEREDLIQRGGRLQTKVAENSIVLKNAGGDAGPEELHQRQQSYELCLTRLGELKLKEQAEKPKLQTQETLQQQVESEWQELEAFKRHAVMAALGRHGQGKRVAHAVDEVLSREQKRAEELVAARLAYAKSNKKKKKNRAPQAGAGGSTDNMSDMLQMQERQKERQLQAEKCEEDLLKIRKSIASTAEVLVHIRESLQWIQAENRAKNAQLAHWEGLLAEKRDLLAEAKQARKRLRARTLELKQHCGMLGNVVLLRDFEDQVDACEHLEGKESVLRRRHCEASLKCARWKQKLGSS